MKYIKLFENHSGYEDFVSGGTMVKPNVSHCVEENEVHYNKFIHDYSKDYFTTEILENGTISFNILDRLKTSAINSISYSKDNGETWTTTNNTDNKSENLVINVQVNEGDNVLWKGDATRLALFYDEDGYGSFFSSTCRFNVMGNIMSLLYGDDFIGQTELFDGGEFSTLFYDSESESGCTTLISAKNLIMPFNTATCACCYQMFNDCTSLTTAPELPATTLESNCYSYMFNGCTSLTVAPALPAITLADWCYNRMFSNCTSLTTSPELPATTLAYACYSDMFRSCFSLTSAPALSATTLANYCYKNMFIYCSGLTTTIAILPATTLANNCYENMFRSCTSLTTAPELPATTLVQSCYLRMFFDCTSLNSITCLATDISAQTCTSAWVNGVASSGTFTKAASMSSWTTGTSGVPDGWTVQTASA